MTSYYEYLDNQQSSNNIKIELTPQQFEELKAILWNAMYWLPVKSHQKNAANLYLNVGRQYGTLQEWETAQATIQMSK
jgi:hypothetical protein